MNPAEQLAKISAREEEVQALIRRDKILELLDQGIRTLNSSGYDDQVAKLTKKYAELLMAL